MSYSFRVSLDTLRKHPSASTRPVDHYTALDPRASFSRCNRPRFIIRNRDKVTLPGMLWRTGQIPRPRCIERHKWTLWSNDECETQGSIVCIGICDSPWDQLALHSSPRQNQLLPPPRRVVQGVLPPRILRYLHLFCYIGSFLGQGRKGKSCHGID